MIKQIPKFNAQLLVTLLEISILYIFVWLVFPKLLLGKELTHILPGVRLSTNLSLKHLVQFSALLIFYATIVINRGPGYLGSFCARFSPTVKVVVIVFLTFGIYWHALPGHTGDTIPTKLLPISIIEEGDIDLDEFRFAVFGGHYYSMVSIDGHYYSAYPIFSGVTITPVYYAVKKVFPEAFNYWKHEYSIRNGDLNDGVVGLLHKFSAVIIAVLIVVVFWLIGKRLGTASIISVPLTIALAVGSPVMSSMTQQVWSHGTAILFMLLAVYFSATVSANKQSSVELILGGLAAAWSVACRPTGLVAASLFTLYVILKHGKRSMFYCVAFSILLFGVFYFNVDLYGKLFGGYQDHVDKFDLPSLERLYKLLMSPSRGLIPFCPYIVILFFFIPKIFEKKVSLLTVAIMACAAELFIYTCWKTWWGGNCFGPRYLSESLMWIFLAILAGSTDIVNLRGVFKKSIWLSCLCLIAYSACLHITGAVYGDKGWDRDFFKGEQALMKWKNSQIVWTFTDIRHDPGNAWKQERWDK